jgi:periplasmic divalent cation tolerance protein
MRIVLSTCRREDADNIAEALVNERLAASVNIVPGVRTKVRFKGEVLTQEECLLIMRTRAELVWRLERRYLELNTWEVPEVATFEIQEWNPNYETWLREATEPVPGHP